VSVRASAGPLRRVRGARGVGGWAASLGLPFPAQPAGRGGGVGKMPGSCTAGWSARVLDRARKAGPQDPGQDQSWIIASMVRWRDWLVFSDLAPCHIRLKLSTIMVRRPPATNTRSLYAHRCINMHKGNTRYFAEADVGQRAARFDRPVAIICIKAIAVAPDPCLYSAVRRWHGPLGKDRLQRRRSRAPLKPKSGD
jgi:hypothetical protein